MSQVASEASFPNEVHNIYFLATQSVLLYVKEYLLCIVNFINSLQTTNNKRYHAHIISSRNHQGLAQWLLKNHVASQNKYVCVQTSFGLSAEQLSQMQNVGLLNIEQASRPEYLEMLRKVCAYPSIQIYDFSEEQCNFLLPKELLEDTQQEQYTPFSRFRMLPHTMVRQELDIIQKEYRLGNVDFYKPQSTYEEKLKAHDLGACFLGLIHYSHRAEVFQKFSPDFRIKLIQGWGVQRDEQLFRHKVLVNIHAKDTYKIGEQGRMNRAIFNQIIVVSEPVLAPEHYFLGKYVLWRNTPEEIEATVMDVLNNYEMYHNSIYGTNFHEIVRTEIADYYEARVLEAFEIEV